MAPSSPARRRLWMHPAHRTVGVGHERLVLGPYGPADSFSTDRRGTTPTRVALAAYQPDAEARAAMALCEQVIARRSDLRCRHVEMDALGAASGGLADADCVVIFGRELQVLPAWTDVAATARAAGGSSTARCHEVRVEMEAAAQWHPVLEGVEPFVSRLAAPEEDRLPDDATLLLSGRSDEAVQPAAWPAPPLWQDLSHPTGFRGGLRSIGFRPPAAERGGVGGVCLISRGRAEKSCVPF